MKKIFADACYWIALINPHDQLHEKSVDLANRLSEVHFVTTDEVLTELLNYFSSKDYRAKEVAIGFIRDALSNPKITVIMQSRDSFLEGLGLYEKRIDKQYSLTDCISMCMMKKSEINDVLTADLDFQKEGFTILL
jgi:predicted nucleic acid-binding protein